MNKISLKDFNKLILETYMLKEDNEPDPNEPIKYSKDGIPLPSNSGEAAEYLFAYYLATIDSQKTFDEKTSVMRSNPAIFSIPGIHKEYTSENILTAIQESVHSANDNIVKKAVISFFNSASFRKEIKRDDYIVKILLLGKSEAGITAADLEIITKKGIKKKASLKKAKSGAQSLYQTGENTSGGFIADIKTKGGGILKLYNIFGLRRLPNEEQLKNVNAAYDNLSNELNKKFQTKNTEEYLQTIMRIIQRDDPDVDLLHSIYKAKIIYPKLLQKFFDYITEIKHVRVNGAGDLPYIKVQISCYRDFDISKNTSTSMKVKDQLESDFNNSLNNIKNTYNKFYEKYSSLDQKTKKELNINLKKIGIMTPLEKDFKNTYLALKDFIENTLEKLSKHSLIQIRLKSDGVTYIEKLAGLQPLSDLNEFFTNIEYKKEYNSFVEIINEIFNMHAKIKKAKQKPVKLKEEIINFYHKSIILIENKQKILNKIKSKINSLDKKDLGIISVTPSNKSEAALVVRCEDKENIESARAAVKSAIEELGLSANNRVIAKFEPSTESTEVPMGDNSGGVYIVYKYDTGSREGLALEHIMALLLTKKVTPELKNRLDLPPEAAPEEVKDKLKSDYADVLKTGLQGKQLVQDKIGEILQARSEGSRNSKADLILSTADGHTYGLSIKLVTEKGREVRFTYNKNLGYGDEEEDNLVNSPSGRPWWLIGRQIFAKKLGRQFKGNAEELEPPGWMTKAKESKSDIYKEAMEDVYAKLREVFVNNLRRMKLKDLVSMVNEAHSGGKQEEEYEKLFVLTSDVDGIRLEERGQEKPDIDQIRMMSKEDLVKTDGARIIIDIPGMDELTIHGLKFHSNMLSSNREDLKIKTR